MVRYHSFIRADFFLDSFDMPIYYFTYFCWVWFGPQTINSATKPLMSDNAREAINKIVKIVNIFGIGITIPPISSR